MTTLPEYEVYAIRYARHDRRASLNFLGGDLHDGPMPLDYFVWLIRGGGRAIVVDTGFSAVTAARRGREFLLHPVDGLMGLGVDAAQVRDVVLTHLHYDHVGNFASFPAATFHLQDREMAYATGRHMTAEVFRSAYEVEDVVGVVKSVYAGRVCFHDGDAELCAGVTLHGIGGHTAGLQVVRVMTRRGWVLLASDATHLYANMDETRPFPIVYSVADMVEGFRRMRALAAWPTHVVPGHDPLVMERYPPPTPELAGIVVRLD